jgi:hypothetical protein
MGAVYSPENNMPGPLQRQMGAVYSPENNNEGPIGRTDSVPHAPRTLSTGFPARRTDSIGGYSFFPLLGRREEVVSKVDTDKFTGSVVEDDKPVDYPFMCDGLMSEQRNPSLASYVNRLLNRASGVRVSELEPILSYRYLSKQTLNPTEGIQSGR